MKKYQKIKAAPASHEKLRLTAKIFKLPRKLGQTEKIFTLSSLCFSAHRLRPIPRTGFVGCDSRLKLVSRIMVHTLRFLAATSIQDNSRVVYDNPSSEGTYNPGLLSRLMYFFLEQKVPKIQGCTRFARKTTFGS